MTPEQHRDHPAGKSSAYGYCAACHRSFSVFEMRDHEDCNVIPCTCGEGFAVVNGLLLCPVCDAPSCGPDMPRLKGRKDRWWL